MPQVSTQRWILIYLGSMWGFRSGFTGLSRPKMLRSTGTEYRVVIASLTISVLRTPYVYVGQSLIGELYFQLFRFTLSTILSDAVLKLTRTMHVFIQQTICPWAVRSGVGTVGTVLYNHSQVPQVQPTTTTTKEPATHQTQSKTNRKASHSMVHEWAILHTW